MKELCSSYRRRNNHLYLNAAYRTIKKGVVEFAGYRWRARHDAATLEGLRVYVCYASGNLVAWCGTKWIIFIRCRATLKTTNIPIWDFNSWVPVLKQKTNEHKTKLKQLILSERKLSLVHIPA